MYELTCRLAGLLAAALLAAPALAQEGGQGASARQTMSEDQGAKEIGQATIGEAGTANLEFRLGACDRGPAAVAGCGPWRRPMSPTGIGSGRLGADAGTWRSAPGRYSRAVTGPRSFDRGGRRWTVRRVRREDAEDADFDFWFDGMTPEERVMAVHDALESSLKAQGFDGVPRLRRVHRRVERA